jgi:aspartyl-tRNA(Asn)/glutamyl-tRNA(Gln) amidotransferase subunit C
MAALTREDVEEIAYLARLALSDDEVERMRVDLSAILGHMDALAEVDTSAVTPMTHAVPMDLPLRADVPRPSLSVEQATAGAPAVLHGSFVVPNIIKTAADRE